MGSQQLLLIIVAVVLIGISVAIGVWMFIDQGVATNRDSVSNDLVQYAAQAQKYFRKPRTLGGGNNSFSGLTLSKVTSKSTNANGTYSLSPDPAPADAASVQIIGLGLEFGSDGETPLRMTMTVWSDSILIVAEN